MTASDPPDPETPDDATLTADDIVAVNRQAVARTAAFTRLAGTALVIAGAVGAVAWLWMAIRHQQTIDDFGGMAPVPSDVPVDDGATFSIYGDAFEVSFPERLDILAGEIPAAVMAVLAVGLGLGLRLVADYVVARTGGSLSGHEAGDRV